jgi:hypothetical protein
LKILKKDKYTEPTFNWFEEFDRILESHELERLKLEKEHKNAIISERLGRQRYEELFQDISGKIPQHIPRSIWERPLKQWMRIRVQNPSPAHNLNYIKVKNFDFYCF